MELNSDTFQVVWRHLPVLIMVFTVLVRLVNETRQLNRVLMYPIRS